MSNSYRDSSQMVPILSGSVDYELWQLLMSASLAADGVWKFIDDTAVLPVRDSDEREYQFQARLEAYRAQAARARMLIISSCKPAIQKKLETVASAKDCWEKLKSLYKSSRKTAIDIDNDPLKAWCKALADEDCKEVERLWKVQNDLLNLGWESDGQAWVNLPDVGEKRPRTALHVAARRGDLQLMEQILGMAANGEEEHEVCPNSTSCHLLKIVNGDYDLDALAIAVVNGNPDIVSLLKKASLRCGTEDVSNPYGITKNMAAASTETVQQGGKDGETVQQGGKTIYQNGKDGPDPDYETHVRELSTITDKTLTALNTEDRDLIKELYDRDCDFNFLPRSVYLFQFTFSVISTDQDTSKQQTLGERIRKDILAMAVAWVLPPDTKLKLVEFLLFKLWDGQGRTALHVAVDSCRVIEFTDMIQETLRDFDCLNKRENFPRDCLNIRDSVGRTPLYRAAVANDPVGVKVLLADERTDVRAIVEYSADKWGADLDIDKLSRRNFFESDCVYITNEKLESKNFNTETRARGGPGPYLRIVKKASSTALHAAIIHKNELVVQYLLDPKKYPDSKGIQSESNAANTKDGHRWRGECQTVDRCLRRFTWPVLPGGDIHAVQDGVSALQLSVLVGNSVILQAVREEDKKEQERKDSTRGVDITDSFLLAAAIGNPDAIKTFLDKGQDPLVRDGLRNTALHHALRGKYVKIHPHIIDFVSCNHVFSWRRENDAEVSAWLAEPLYTNPLRKDTDEKTGKSKVLERIGQRQGAINLLLQAGVNIWTENDEKRTARPPPDAPQDFVIWWYQKVAEQTQQTQEKLNAAANAISVTAALVATASYLGPFQPPLGYGTDAVQVEISAVTVFVSFNSVSFYLALAAILYGLLPSLPVPDVSTFEELRRTRILVAISLVFLSPSIILFLLAFVASYIAVMPDRGFAYHGLGSTTVLGVCFSLLAISGFVIRLLHIIFTLPEDHSDKISFKSELLPGKEFVFVLKTGWREMKNICRMKYIFICSFFASDSR